MQTATAVSQQQTAWHTTAWAYTRSITLERTVNIMRLILTPGAARAFTQKEITIPVLAKHLPLYDSRLHAKYRLVYAMIGRHEDGRMALYSGSTNQPRQRIYSHMKCLRLVRQRKFGNSSISHAHWVLGKPGWNVEIHVICRMDSSILFVWKFFFEAIFIILMRTLDTTAINNYQNVHVINLVKSLEPKHCPDAGAVEPMPTPCLVVSDDAGEPPLRLNRCLPTLQGFFPSRQDRKDQKAKKCHWCRSTESPAWNRVQDDETLTKYQRQRCYSVESRRTLDPAGVAIREKRDERRSRVLKDFCASLPFCSVLVSELAAGIQARFGGVLSGNLKNALPCSELLPELFLWPIEPVSAAVSSSD